MEYLESWERAEQIESFEPLKLLGDRQKLTILRLLMVKPATLTQLGEVMEAHPAQVRYHLKRLEKAGLVTMTARREVRGVVEKYYQATARAFIINLTIVPDSPHGRTILAMGSHDLALELLAQQMREQHDLDLISIPVGSLDGLIALRQGVCQMAGCHLYDAEQGEYNRSFVRTLFPGQAMVLVTLAHRQQGLLLPPGNPRGLSRMSDLLREDVTIINRKRGSGTRLWIDRQFGLMGVLPQQVRGYRREANTHLQVAEAVAEGEVDVGVGVLAAARRFNLDFAPLFEERYDLVMPVEAYTNPLLHPVLDYLETAVFREAVSQLGGYNTTHTGEEIRIEPLPGVYVIDQESQPKI